MQDLQKGFSFLAILVGMICGGWLLVQLTPVLAPFLVAALLAYLSNPIVEKLSQDGKYKIPRTLSVMMVFVFISLLAMLALVYLIPILQNQINDLIEMIPALMIWLQETFIPKLQAFVGIEFAEADLQFLRNQITEHWSKASNTLAFLTKWLFASGMTAIQWVINLFLIFVVTFYLLRDWHACIKASQNILPKSIRSKTIHFCHEADKVMGSFLKGQLSVMLGLGLIYTIGLSLIGLKFSALLGISAGVLSIVPYLGTVVGIVSALLVAIMQSSDLSLLIWVSVVFGVGQVIESVILTPMLVGDKLGLHPVFVIFAVLAGGQLLGMVGVLMAIPVAAILVVLLREPILEWANRS